MSKDKRPAPPESTATMDDPEIQAAAAKIRAVASILAIEVGVAVTVWPHVGDRGCYQPWLGEVVKIHMPDCVDVKATVKQGDREYERTFIGVILVGSRGRERGEPGTFEVF